jgi:hypothetical protein
VICSIICSASLAFPLDVLDHDALGFGREHAHLTGRSCPNRQQRRIA